VIQIVPNIPIKPDTVTRGEDYCLPILTESWRTSPCRLCAIYSQVLVLNYTRYFFPSATRRRCVPSWRWIR